MNCLNFRHLLKAYYAQRTNFIIHLIIWVLGFAHLHSANFENYLIAPRVMLFPVILLFILLLTYWRFSIASKCKLAAFFMDFLGLSVLVFHLCSNKMLLWKLELRCHDGISNLLFMFVIFQGKVVVIRGEGPKGGPGMLEMLTPTSAIMGAGLGKVWFY